MPAHNNCQSMDPYSLLNRLGTIDKSKLNEQMDNFEKISLAEFKMNTEQINRQLNKMASDFQQKDFDQSMSHLVQPRHHRA